MDCEPAGTRPRFAAGNDPNPAVVEFEIEGRAGGDRLGCGDDACDRIAHHDIAARQQALMTFRMGGEAPGEIVDGLVLSADSARQRCAQPRLGLGDPVPLSAEHGEGMIDLFDALLLALPELTEAPPEDEEEAQRPELAEDEDGSDLDLTKPLRIAVVGRPNAGKSTLINRLLGEERLLTGPEAGITRDSIGIEFKWREREMKLFDTAGLRKRARVVDKLEKLAGADALRAVRFAEVVVLLVDSAIPFEKQDLTIADIAASEGRAVVIALGKWDAVEDRGKTLSNLREEAERLLPQLRGCKVVPVSGTTGLGLDALMQAVIETHEVWNKRISTGRLNRWLESALAENPPPAVSGRRIKIRYVTQPKSRPPHFTFFGNQLDELPTSYERYLINSLRKAFDLPGVPIRISRRMGENPYEGKKRG